MYNLDFIVKYKQIEEDLIKKIDAGENEYSREDVYNICDELYRNELLAVFYGKNFEEKNINKSIDDLWNKLKDCPDFLTILHFYKKKTDTYTNYSNEDVYIFTEMFNYHLFYLIHPFIQKILRYMGINTNTNKEEIESYILSLKNVINNL
jgi:hypothetical protein